MSIIGIRKVVKANEECCPITYFARAEKIEDAFKILARFLNITSAQAFENYNFHCMFENKNTGPFQFDRIPKGQELKFIN